MPEIIAAPAPPAPGAPAVDPKAAPAGDPALLAGKYKDAQALEKGYRELNNTLGLPALADTKALLGEGTPFADVKALESGYKVLDALYTKAKTEPAPAKPAEIKPGEPLSITAPPELKPGPGEDDMDFDGLLTKAGLSKQELYEQWNKDPAQGGGKLTDAQYAKAKAVGWGRKITDSIVGAQVVAFQASIELVRRTAAEAAGGREQLTALLGWANTHYKADPAMAKDIDRRINNPATTAAVVRQLKYEYAEAAGAEHSRPLVHGTAVPAGEAEPVADAAEYETLLAKVNAGTASPAEVRRFNRTKPSVAIRR